MEQWWTTQKIRMMTNCSWTSCISSKLCTWLPHCSLMSETFQSLSKIWGQNSSPLSVITFHCQESEKTFVFVMTASYIYLAMYPVIIIHLTNCSCGLCLTRSMSLVMGISRMGFFIRHRVSRDVPKQLGR